jgi:hypothetical protein
VAVELRIRQWLSRDQASASSVLDHYVDGSFDIVQVMCEPSATAAEH